MSKAIYNGNLVEVMYVHDNHIDYMYNGVMGTDKKEKFQLIPTPGFETGQIDVRKSKYGPANIPPPQP